MEKEKTNIEEKQYRVFPVELKGIDTEKATLEAIFSTSKEDRHGDVVLQEGWDLKNFKKNPVILNSHNYGDAAEVIGKAINVKVEDGKLQGKIIFAVNENPKAKVIFDLYAGGFLNAFSVGFMIKKFATDQQGLTDYYTIAESELLEVSAVSVPANAQALAKSKGIDVDLLDMKGSDDDDEQDIEDDVEDEFDEKGCRKPGKPKPKKEVSCEECEKRRQEEIADAEAKKEDESKVEPETPAEPIVQESYNSKVAKALKNIEATEKEAWQKAAKIIASLLDSDTDGLKLEAKVRNQVKKRKVNQAIRELLKTK